MNWNLDEIREWITHQPASRKIKQTRIQLFDIYRYQEEYEKIYQMIQDIKKQK